MAKATLPTNYQDDVLKSTMGGKRRYTMTDNSDGTKTLEDATQYEKVGSNFGAADINKTNTAVNAAADASKIIDNVNDIKANTQAGYMMGALAGKQLISDLASGQIEFSFQDGKGAYRKKGADTWLPFKGPLKIPYLTLSAGNKTFLPLDAEGYKNLSFTYQSKHPIMNLYIYGGSHMPTSQEELVGSQIYFKEAEAVDYSGSVNLDISAYKCVTLYLTPASGYTVGALYINNFVMQ